MEKKCVKCGIVKEVTEYHKVTKSKDGKHSTCKTCRCRRKQIIDINDGKKICNKCLIRKELSNFNKDNRKVNGYRPTCISCKSQYRQDNIEKMRKIEKLQKEKRIKNNELLGIILTYKKCRCCAKIKNVKEYYINKLKKDGYSIYCKICSREKINEKERYRIENEPLYKLMRRIRSLIGHSLKGSGYKKNSKTNDILGCSYKDFKLYIESKFESWMNWNNNGEYTGNYNETWQYDHIIPLASAQSEEEIIKLNHFSNFQPLCSRKNSEKRAKLYY